MGLNDKETGTGRHRHTGVGDIFKVVVQALLLFGLEMWVMTPRTGWALGGFHYRMAQIITGRQPCQISNSSWEYPHIGERDIGGGFGGGGYINLEYAE